MDKKIAKYRSGRRYPVRQTYQKQLPYQKRTIRCTKEVKLCLLVLFLLLLLPLLLVKISIGEETKAAIRQQREEIAQFRQTTENPSGYVADYETSSGTIRVPIELCLVSELAAIMPGDAQPEALKAAAILLRTQMVYEITTFGSYETEHYQSLEGWKKVWGEHAEMYLTQYQDAVSQTGGVIAVFEGAPVSLPFHQVSAGQTRDGLEDVIRLYPYLKQAECNEDLLEADYLSKITMTHQEFCQKLEALAGQKDISDASVTIDRRDSAGYVSEMTVSGDSFATFSVGGETFRETFSLPSAHFTMEQTENAVTFLCLGVGHGYGMSLYYANTLAGKGSDCMSILCYFFQNLDFMRIA